MMNDELQVFARHKLKVGLALLPEGQQMLFKRMYSHTNLEMPINDCVDQMPQERLDWAMTQVENSLKALAKKV